MNAQLSSLAAAVAVAALLTPAASAEPKGHGKAKNTVFKGIVVSVEPVRVTVDVIKASNWGRSAEGRRVTFVAGDHSRIRVPDRNGDGRAGLADLQPDGDVKVMAIVPEGEAFGNEMAIESLTIAHEGL